MEIIKDNNNTLLKRQELVFEANTNVSFDEARKQIADKTKKSEEVIDVYNVKGGFGNQKFLVKANIYNSKEDLEIMKNMELSKKQKKEKEEAQAKSEEETKSPPEETTENTEQPPEKNEESAVAEEKPDTAPVEERESEKVAEEKPVEAPMEE
jgi:ribosomal protein S24E